jgi:hypothetical protein
MAASTAAPCSVRKRSIVGQTRIIAGSMLRHRPYGMQDRFPVSPAHRAAPAGPAQIVQQGQRRGGIVEANNSTPAQELNVTTHDGAAPPQSRRTREFGPCRKEAKDQALLASLAAFSARAHNESATQSPEVRLLPAEPQSMLPIDVALLSQTAGNYCSLSDSRACRARAFFLRVRPIALPPGFSLLQKIALYQYVNNLLMRRDSRPGAVIGLKKVRLC